MFVFGHAADPQKVIGNVEDVKAMQNFMEKLEAYVADGIKAGKSQDELKTATSIPGVTDWQGNGIQRGIQSAYEELTKS